MSEKTGDVVYTPSWVAEDMVKHFNPTGAILDPCRGKGIFGIYLASHEWCEVNEGRDFFTWKTPVDVVMGNPPYSLTRKWFRHSYTVADRLIYLVPLRNVFSGYGFIREIYNYGGIAEIRNYGTGGTLGFPMGNAVGAFDIRKGYEGPMTMSFAQKPVGARADVSGLPVIA